MSAGTLQRMTGPRAPHPSTFPPHSIAPSPGPRPQNIQRAGCALDGVSRGSPADPRTPGPPDFPRASSQGDPRPTSGQVLTYIWERPGGQWAARAQEPPGPRAAPGAWQRRRGRRGQQVLGRAPRPRLPGRLLAPRSQAQPQALPSSSHLAQSPAPPRSPAPWKGSTPTVRRVPKKCGSALDRDCRTAHPALHSHSRLLCRMGAEPGPTGLRVAPPTGPGSGSLRSSFTALRSHDRSRVLRIRWAGSPDACPAHPPVRTPEARAAGVYKGFY